VVEEPAFAGSIISDEEEGGDKLGILDGCILVKVHQVFIF
jgi:hypothetical protein